MGGKAPAPSEVQGPEGTGNQKKKKEQRSCFTELSFCQVSFLKPLGRGGWCFQNVFGTLVPGAHLTD